MVTSVAVGNILGIIINTYLVTAFGERYAFLIPGLLTVILGIAVCICTKVIGVKENAEKKGVSFLKLLKKKDVLLMTLPALFHGVMKENVVLWMAVFVVDIYGVDLKQSAYYILLIPIAGFAGRMIYPALLKLFKSNENTVSAAAFIFCILASLLIAFLKIGMAASVIALSIIYAAVSVINTSMLSIYPMRYAKTGNVASVSGVMDFATYLGAGISGVIYGIVIKSYGYMPMFVSWAVISFVSVFLLRKKNVNR